MAHSLIFITHIVLTDIVVSCIVLTFAAKLVLHFLSKSYTCGMCNYEFVSFLFFLKMMC